LWEKLTFHFEDFRESITVSLYIITGSVFLGTLVASKIKTRIRDANKVLASKIPNPLQSGSCCYQDEQPSLNINLGSLTISHSSLEMRPMMKAFSV